MKVRHFGIAAGSIVAMCGLVMACSDDSTSSSSSGGSSSGGASSSSSGGSSSGSTSSSSSSSSGGASQCELAPGKYTVKNTRTAGDPTKCPEPPAQTIEIKETDGGSNNNADAGSDCKVTIDEAACSSVIECTFSQSGFTTTSRTTFSTKDLKGTQSSKTVQDSDGTVLSDCSYDVTWTKQ